MNENHSFTARFVFKNFEDAQSVRDLMATYAYWVEPKVSESKRFKAIVRKERWQHLMKIVSSKGEILSHDLFKLYEKHYETSYKTFQRDIGLLILQGNLKAKKAEDKRYSLLMCGDGVEGKKNERRN